MDIPLDVGTHCSDGRCGRSTYIIINPAVEQVTLLVVREPWPSQIERLVPPEELAVRRGARGHASDGVIGKVDQFLAEPSSGYISHLILREGLPWDQKHIAVPHCRH